MHEIDFLSVESNTGISTTKSGDAIAIRFVPDNGGAPKIVLIDAGFHDHGKDLVEHVLTYYDTRHVDLVISTHPDRDHIGGLGVVLEELDVDELLLHQPRRHAANVSDFGNLGAIDDLVNTANSFGVRITSPFTGQQRLDGHILVLGPTQAYYEQLVLEHLAEAAQQHKAAVREQVSLANLMPGVRTAWLNGLSFLPIETLSDEVTTGPRNNTSVITLLQVGGHRLLFTGDAGIPALDAAADYYEDVIGSFAANPLRFLQVPHHGSRRNLGPSVLDRILGPKDGTPFAPVTAFVSSAEAAPKHPSPKVTNALTRRGCSVAATEGRSICHHEGYLSRPNWSPLTPIPALPEADDDE